MTTIEEILTMAPVTTVDLPTHHHSRDMKWASLVKRHIELMDEHVKFLEQIQESMRAEMSALEKEEQMQWERGEVGHWKSLCGMIERARIGREDANSSYKFATTNKIRKQVKSKSDRAGDGTVINIKSGVIGVDGKALSGVKLSSGSIPLNLQEIATLNNEVQDHDADEDYLMQDRPLSEIKSRARLGEDSKELRKKLKKLIAEKRAAGMELSTGGIAEKLSRKRRVDEDEEPIDEKKVKKIKKQKRVKGLAKQSEEVARIVEERLKERAKRAAEEDEEDETGSNPRKEKKRKRRGSEGSQESLEDPETTPKKKHRGDREKRKSIEDLSENEMRKKRKSR
ncbi:hypothetical protein F5884DRAFT_800407 [Xylogone sp. PMI_703]|nr:hypothetical protein F5884DRAFT_800407 [Xylogone sp. PMI_703]